MFHFVGLMPLVPSLIIFGTATVLLYYGKKNKSTALKVGGWVMAIGAVFLIIATISMFSKRGHADKPRCGCPMMEMMKGQDCGNMNMGMMNRPMNPPAPPAPMPKKM